VLAFKRRNNLGRFSDNASDTSSVASQNRGFEEAAKNIKIGDRCEVDVGGVSLKRRGTVRFVGMIPSFFFCYCYFVMLVIDSYACSQTVTNSHLILNC
jgi:hypothetical protein